MTTSNRSQFTGAAERDAKEDAMAATIVRGLEKELTKWTWIDRSSVRVGAGTSGRRLPSEVDPPVDE
jgi:hypothetical protein